MVFSIWFVPSELLAQTQTAAEPWWRNPEWWTVIVAGLAIIVAAAAFAVNVYQAIKTRDQAQAAQDQVRIMRNELALATSPRLYVEGVRVENLTAHGVPIFFFKIVNVGPATAERATVHLQIRMADGGTRYVKDHVVTIPANGTVEHFIDSGMLLTEQTMHSIQYKGALLCVEGHVTQGEKLIPFCYKYKPWLGSRPQSVPMFIPCDFHERRVISATMDAGSIVPNGSTANIVTPTIDSTAKVGRDTSSPESGQPEPGQG